MKHMHDLLKWCAEQAGVKLLEISRFLKDGFRDVVVVSDDTFYGIYPAFNWKDLHSVKSADEARGRTDLSDDFSDAYFERARRIALDMQQRSKREGFEFYNGKLARLKSITVQEGESPSDQVLELKIGYTSYFTALGTNIFYDGYQFVI